MCLPARERVTTLFERFTRLDALHEWSAAEDDSGDERDRANEAQHLRIQADLSYSREIDRELQHEHFQTPPCQTGPDDGRDRREHEAFGHELLTKAKPVRTERDPHAHFLLPSCSPSKQKVDDVHACNEPHKSNRGEE